jgi:hypothetical protein
MKKPEERRIRKSKVNMLPEKSVGVLCTGFRKYK